MAETPIYITEERTRPSTHIVENADGNGWGTGMQITQFTNVMFEVVAGGTPDITVEVFVSYQEEEPVWEDPFAADNRYYPVACMDLDAQAGVTPGSTGIAVSAVGGKHYILSTQGANWLNFKISRLDGEVNIWATPYANQ
jgi:hypothetical protein